MTRVLALLAALIALAVAPAARAAQPSLQLFASARGASLVDAFAAGPDGALASLGAGVPTGARPAALALSPDGRSLYVADQGDGALSQFSVADDGTLTAKRPATVPAGEAPSSVAVAPDGDHVYATDRAAGAVRVFDVGPDGALTPAAEVPAGEGAVTIALTPDGTSAYVADYDAGAISRFAVAGDGSLRPLDPVALDGPSHPFGVAVASDGASAYVTDQAGAGSVRQFDAGPDGLLSPKAPAAVAAGASPTGIVAGERGVYVANFGDDTVSAYDAGVDGALAPKPGSRVAAGHEPWSVALAPDGASLYASNFGGSSISQYDLGADGAPAPKAPASVAADAGPVGLAVRVAPDVTAPTVDLVAPADGATYGQGDVVLADFTCADEGPSGLASCEGDVPSGDPIDTATPGPHTFTVVARDGAGHETSVEHAYTVTGTPPAKVGWAGFAWPVLDLPAINRASAGRSVLVRFRLTGADDVDPSTVLSDGSPSSVQVDCRHPGAPVAGWPARSADGRGVVRDRQGAFTFAWATEQRWTGTCRMLILQLRDGSTHRALFAFGDVKRWP